MVRYWFTRGGSRWRAKALVNGVGATATGVVALVVIYRKFARRAWLMLLHFFFCAGSWMLCAAPLTSGSHAGCAWSRGSGRAPPAHNTTLAVVEQIWTRRPSERCGSHA